MKKLTAIIGLSLLLGGCAVPSAQPVDKCLLQPDKDAKILVGSEGARVGFCCNRCEGEFEGMSDTAKRAKLVDKRK